MAIASQFQCRSAPLDCRVCVVAPTHHTISFKKTRQHDAFYQQRCKIVHMLTHGAPNIIHKQIRWSRTEWCAEIEARGKAMRCIVRTPGGPTGLPWIVINIITLIWMCGIWFGIGIWNRFLNVRKQNCYNMIWQHWHISHLPCPSVQVNR